MLLASPYIKRDRHRLFHIHSVFDCPPGIKPNTFCWSSNSPQFTSSIEGLIKFQITWIQFNFSRVCKRLLFIINISPCNITSCIRHTNNQTRDGHISKFILKLFLVERARACYENVIDSAGLDSIFVFLWRRKGKHWVCMLYSRC